MYFNANLSLMVIFTLWPECLNNVSDTSEFCHLVLTVQWTVKKMHKALSWRYNKSKSANDMLMLIAGISEFQQRGKPNSVQHHSNLHCLSAQEN